MIVFVQFQERYELAGSFRFLVHGAHMLAQKDEAHKVVLEANGLPPLAMFGFLWQALRACKRLDIENAEEAVLKSQEPVMSVKADERAFFCLKPFMLTREWTVSASWRN